MFDPEYVQQHKGLLFAVSVAFTLILVNLIVLVGVVRSKPEKPRVTPQPTPITQTQPLIATPTSFPSVPQPLEPEPQPVAPITPPTTREKSFVPLFFQPKNPYTGEPIGYTDPFEFIENLIFVAMAGGLLVAFFILLKGGYLYITSEGDEAKTERAKKTIIMALVGIGIIALSSAILSAAGILFGINFFDLSSFSIPGPSNTYYP
jgi:hypothetical protein